MIILNHVSLDLKTKEARPAGYPWVEDRWPPVGPYGPCMGTGEGVASIIYMYNLATPEPLINILPAIRFKEYV